MFNERKIIHGHEKDKIEEQFSKETLELWNPYFDLLNGDDWFLEDTPNQGWYLKTPFYQDFNFDSKLDMSLPEHKKWTVNSAIHRYGYYYKLICNPKSTISNIIVASCYVKKWTREKFLLRYLQTFNIKRFSDKEIWSLIREIWMNNESNCHSVTTRNAWKEIFKIRPRPESLVSHLPEKLTVYRGGHPDGYAWTNFKKSAEEFQNRNAIIYGDDENFLSKRIVTRDEVAFTDESSLDIDDGENEIVLFPKKDPFVLILKDAPER